MSDPKSSRYTLTSERRSILAEQRKIKRRKVVAAERIRKAQKQFLQIGGMFNAEKQIASELFNRTGNDNGMTTLISGLETLITPIQSLVSRTNYEDVNSVEETETAVCACLKEADICSVCIRIARDMFDLLPVSHTIVYAVLSSNTIISVDFDRVNLSKVKFGYIDSSDTLSLFKHNMNYSSGAGFAPVANLE